jgi:hypothetical protein
LNRQITVGGQHNLIRGVVDATAYDPGGNAVNGNKFFGGDPLDRVVSHQALALRLSKQARQ